MIGKVLVATRSFGSTSQKPWDVLTEAGCEVVKADMKGEITAEHMIDLLKDINGAVVGVVPMTAQVLDNAPQLKVVSMHGVGVDHINLDAAERLGIVIANCPGTNDQAVADLALGLMIAAARQISAADGALRAGQWGKYSGSELWNKTLGLIGYGRIGRGVAKRALGFDMNVQVYDPYIQSRPGWFTRGEADLFGGRDYIGRFPVASCRINRRNAEVDRDGAVGDDEAYRIPDQHCQRRADRRTSFI